MTRLYALLPALMATPVLAHDGAHLHPHGIGIGWALIAASLGGVAVGYVVARVRK